METGTLGLAGEILDGLCLGIGLGHILADKVVEECVDILRSLGHCLLKRVGSIAGIAHYFCLFSP